VRVAQVQGVKGATDLMRPLRWEKLLYQVMLDWAAANGITQVRVLPAEQNRWFGLHRAERMKMLYDVTAKRMGFRWDPDEHVYYKNVSP
jgi:hypothetical protein